MHSLAHNAVYMLQSCGQRVYKALVAVGEVVVLVRSLLPARSGHVHNRAENTPAYTQVGTFLCTTYEQLFFSFTSVSQLLVHTVHRAYKYQSNSNEGAY